MKSILKQKDGMTKKLTV